MWTIEKGCARRAGSGKERVVTFLLFPPRTRSTRGIGPLWIFTRSSPDFFVYTFSFTSALTSVSADDRDAKVREWGVQGLYFLSRVFHSKKNPGLKYLSGNFQTNGTTFAEKMTTLRGHRNVWRLLTGTFCSICLSSRNFRNIRLNVSLLGILTISGLTGNISWKFPYRWKAPYVPNTACSLMEFTCTFTQ